VRKVACSGRWLLWTVLFLSLGPSWAWAESDSQGDGPWKFGTAVNARLRYEFVDDDAITRQANAFTLRTRLAFSATRSRFGTALFEFEDVRAIGDPRFNSTANGMTDFPVVADPDATELNRAWLSHTIAHAIGFKLGRQIVNRDRGRIIGHVGWRQNQQTFDGLTAARTEGKFRFWSGYLTRANRIFGDEHPNPINRHFELDAWVGEGEVRLSPGTLTAIVHYLEFENDLTRSHRNLGLRWVGTHRFDDDRRIEYRAEWIDQGSHADGDATNEADYLAAEIGYETKRWGVGANLEQLSGDGIYGFQRPLATLHAYNGWADQFLNTPADGLVDVFADGRLKVKGCALSFQYHRFDSDTGSLHYGDELGLAVSHKFRGRYGVVLKYANYNADDVGADVQKVWLSVQIAEHFDFRKGS